MNEKRMQTLLTVPLENGSTLKKETEMKTVHEVTEITGVTRKTLFYYDKIGLLKPADRIGTQNAKIYDDSAILKLKAILTLKEAGLKIQEIDRILNKKESIQEVLISARNRLLKEKQEIDIHLNKLNEMIERNGL